MAENTTLPPMAGAVDPQSYADLMVQQQQLQRQQALAQMLMQGALTPQQSEVVTGRVVPVSPFSGMTKIAQALLGNKLNSDNDTKVHDIGQAQGTLYARAQAQAAQQIASILNGGAPAQGAPQADPQAAPAQQPPVMPPGMGFRMPGATPLSAQPGPTPQLANGVQPDSIPPSFNSAAGSSPLAARATGMITAGMSPAVQLMYPKLSEKFGEKGIEMTMPTNELKNLNDPIFGPAFRAELEAKGIKEVNGYLFKGNQLIGQLPKAPDGTTATLGVNSQGLTTPTQYQPIPGYIPAVANNAAAQAFGTNSQQIAQIETNDGKQSVPATQVLGTTPRLPYPSYGAPQPAQAAPTPRPVAQPAPVATRPAVAQPAASGQWTPPPTRDPVTMGQSPSQRVQAEEMSKYWMDISSRAAQANQVINNLDQIALHAKDANTGPFAKYKDMGDAVLSMLGSNNAAERLVASQLLGKNANQITAALGQGKTDAANDMIHHAFPNNEMLKKAISEAVDNLKAQERMNVARTNALLPYRLAPQSMAEVRNHFDTTADPRIFQFLHMPKGTPEQQAAANAYLEQIMSQDPSLIERAKELKRLGWNK